MIRTQNYLASAMMTAVTELHGNALTRAFCCSEAPGHVGEDPADSW